MKKSFTLALLLTVSSSLTVFAEALDTSSSTSPYVLDEGAAEIYKLKENTPVVAEQKKLKIVKDDIEGGFVEKLYDVNDQLIAEKMIKNDVVEQQILYYYYPDGKISRRIIAVKDSNGFFAEEYYSNGKLASFATFLNAENKIGQEKKYDTNGVLRQEVTWVLPAGEEGDNSLQKTIRYGDVVTYYPDGAKAAIFSVGKKGQNIFFKHNGDVIKEVNNAEILNFADEVTTASCEEKAVRLSLEELIELYEDEGDISYNKCGMPYREAFVYEVMDVKDGIASLVSYDQTGQIRRITPYVNEQKHGTEQKFDASGSLTAEINYQNGMKNGIAVGFFPSRAKAFQKQYVNGKEEGELLCYFPTGEVAARFQYKNGLKEGKAQINSPVAQQLEFVNNNLINAPEKAKERQLVSLIDGLETADTKCMKAADKLAEIAIDIEAEENSLNQAFYMPEPEECSDASSYVLEGNNYICYDAEKNKRAVYPQSYALGEYAVSQIYTPDGQHLYDISYIGKKRQGWTKKYNQEGEIIAEAYFNQGELADNSRSYHDNGLVKEMLSIADNGKRKVLTRYNNDGTLMFSLSYKDGEKNQAYISNLKRNKDIFINYYQNAVDNIREVNADKPYNYINYNVALGEYAIFRENELIKGGMLCYDDIRLGDVSPVIPADKAPLIDDLKPIEESDVAALGKLASATEHKPENALIPTEAEKKQAKLAAKNIGPVAKPDIDELADVVSKESLSSPSEKIAVPTLSKTEKFYYPNGNLRKTVKTKGPRTEEVKEYSKTGLLLADTVYNKDNIQIEKYYGSGQIRRKLQKAYDDNAIMAFVSREDFYDNGKIRYMVSRLPEVLLFEEKVYTPSGLKQETTQKSALSLVVKDYDKDEKLLKVTETLGLNRIVKEYNSDGSVQTFTLNGKNMPLTMVDKGEEILKDNAKVYEKGTLKAEIKTTPKQTTLIEYYPGKITKTEIIFFNNGEISVKGFAKDGTLTKFAYLAPDGKLHIQKPVVKTIPNYRERYWVDYNNPHWVENSDKYSVKSINRLYLDTASYILAELGWDVPEQLKQLYSVY